MLETTKIETYKDIPIYKLSNSFAIDDECKTKESFCIYDGSIKRNANTLEGARKIIDVLTNSDSL